jgi:hypothetical protein
MGCRGTASWGFVFLFKTLEIENPKKRKAITELCQIIELDFHSFDQISLLLRLKEFLCVYTPRW